MDRVVYVILRFFSEAKYNEEKDHGVKSWMAYEERMEIYYSIPLKDRLVTLGNLFMGVIYAFLCACIAASMVGLIAATVWFVVGFLIGLTGGEIAMWLSYKIPFMHGVPYEVQDFE